MKEHWGKLLGLQSREIPKDEITSINMELIKTNPYQPRKNFEAEKTKELAQSIKTYGLLQPVIVTRDGDYYRIVAGERRYMACEMLEWTEIPAIVKDYEGSSLAAVALIENLQREDLSFMEEAQGYRRLMDEFELTQEVLAQRLGKSQSTIANKLRLLKLPDEVRELLKEGKLTERHARTLLKLNNPEQQKEAVQVMVDKDLNVKDAEDLVAEMERQGQTEKKLEQQKSSNNKRKFVARDLRIFLNTIKQAINIIKKAGLNPQVDEFDESDYVEIRIRLPKDLS